MSNSSIAKSSSSTSVLARPKIILAMVSSAHAVNHAYATLMPLIYPIVVREFQFSNTQLGFMVGIGNAVSGMLQMVYGSLREYVPRRILLGGGQIVMAISTAATSIATTFNLFFATNLTARIGGSPQHPVGSSILSDQFEAERRGFALAAHVSGGNIGTVLVPLVGTLLIATLGWRSTLLLFAAIAALVGLVIAFALDESATVEEGTRAKSPGSKAEVKAIFANRNIQLIFLASIMAAGGRGLGVLITWVPIYLQNGLGLDPTYSGILFTLLLIGSVVGPLLLGKVSDVRGRRSVLIATYLAAMVLTVFFTMLGGTSFLMPIVLLAMGIAAYSESPLLQAFLADSTEGLNRDLTFALYYTAAFGVGAFWASALGWVIDVHGYTAGFYVMAASYVLAALAVYPMREGHTIRQQ